MAKGGEQKDQKHSKQGKRDHDLEQGKIKMSFPRHGRWCFSYKYIMEARKTREIKNYTLFLILETVRKIRLRRFMGLFWPIFESNFGGNIRKFDITPKI